MVFTTPICGCGQPTNHKGMCSARWAKRKENNGPSGKRDGAPAPALTDHDRTRRWFGDLADDVILLRDRGHLVARFKDGYRIDRDVGDADWLRARAKFLRLPKATPVKAASPTDLPKPAQIDPTDLRARIAQLERDMAHLFAVVADALAGRRDTLIEQAKGLAELEATLRQAA